MTPNRTARSSGLFLDSDWIPDSARLGIAIVAITFYSSAFLVVGCQAQDAVDAREKKSSEVSNTPKSSEQELANNQETATPAANSSRENESVKSETKTPALPEKQDPDRTSAGRKKEVNRRPTKPTDASALADRPEKPKFQPTEKSVSPTEVLDLTFDDLAFEMDEDEDFAWSMITPEIHRYDGAKVKLRGFIKPSFHKENIKQFVFVRDNQECCFGPGAALYDCVLVKMAPGAETDYTVRPITLEGTLYLRKYAGPDGNVWAIFRMKDGKVR